MSQWRLGLVDPSAQGGHCSARLAFSFVSPEQIGEGIGQLAELLAKLPSIMMREDQFH